MKKLLLFACNDSYRLGLANIPNVWVCRVVHSLCKTQHVVNTTKQLRHGSLNTQIVYSKLWVEIPEKILVVPERAPYRS